MKSALTIKTTQINLPKLGRLQLAASEIGLCSVALPDFDDHDLRLGAWAKAGFHISSGRSPVLSQASDELARYTKEQQSGFSVKLDLRYLPPFTSHVLKTLLKVPFGTCMTYGELAKRAGNPAASRAVGGAVGRNPIPIIVPCHRVIASTGIGGFGLGLHCKRVLLGLENITFPINVTSC
jgi:methylated-DNA-[protein]-cysteine S-methyltransferase